MENKQKRQRKDEIMSEAVAHLLSLKAGRILHSWRREAVEEITERLALARASHHYQRVLQHRVLVAWQNRHQIILRKKQLNDLREKFESSRLLSGCYVKWRRQVCEISDEDAALAIIVWII